MMHRSLIAGATLLVAAAPLAAQSAPDTFRLRELTVTATKVAAPLLAVPAHATIITGAALRAQGHTRVVDALRAAAGVSVAQLGAPGAQASLFLRGGESDYVQVLVDGVQVNDPGGAFDWAHLTTADIDRIEIVRGPASVLYGSDAVAGVVQVFTRRGAGAPRVEAEVTAGRGERVGPQAEGSFNTWSGSGALTGSVRLGARLDASYSLNAARQRSDGAYAFNNEYDNTTVSARLGVADARGAALTFTARYTDQRFHYPTDGAGNVVDHNRYTYGESLAAGMSLAQRLGSRLSAQVTLGTYRNDSGGEDPEDEAGQGFSRSTAEVARDNLELRLDAQATRSIIASVGGELEQQQGESTFDSDGPFGPYRSSTEDERANRAAFAQLVRTGERLGITAGARVDHSDQFGSFATARAGLSVQLTPGLRVHGSYGTGFKEPTFLETYATGFARGNPELDPEESRSGELGVRAARGSANVAITGFDQRFRNLIQYTFEAPSEDAPNYYNIGRAEARGVELEAGLALRDAIELTTAYTWLHTEVTDAGFGQDMQFREGESLLRRPEHQLDGTLRWRATSRLSAALEAHYTGERADLDFTDPAEWQGKRVTLESHTTLDAALTFAPAVRFGALETTLRVRNLLDQRYHEVHNFAAPGRIVSVGVRVSR